MASGQTSVGDILQQKDGNVIAVGEGSTIAEVAGLMSRKKIGLLIVLNDSRKFVGVTKLGFTKIRSAGIPALANVSRANSVSTTKASTFSVQVWRRRCTANVVAATAVAARDPR